MVTMQMPKTVPLKRHYTRGYTLSETHFTKQAKSLNIEISKQQHKKILKATRPKIIFLTGELMIRIINSLTVEARRQWNIFNVLRKGEKNLC